MKVVINGQVYDPNETPIVIVFKDDYERRLISKQIAETPDKPGPRAYIQYPSAEQLINGILVNAVKVSGYVG